MKYSETTIRKKAKDIGYYVKKGFRHYMHNNSIYLDAIGNRVPGYQVIEVKTGFAVWGSYNELFDYLWTIEEVENFIMQEYKTRNLKY